MSVPGSNLLNQAFNLIAKQTMTYYPFLSRTKQPNGMLVPNYGPGVTAQGSFQPVSRALMQILGLDMQRSYVNIFISQRVLDVERDVSSDKFVFKGHTYQALSITPWISVDGWNQVLAVKVPNNV